MRDQLDEFSEPSGSPPQVVIRLLLLFCDKINSLFFPEVKIVKVFLSPGLLVLFSHIYLTDCRSYTMFTKRRK